MEPGPGICHDVNTTNASHLLLDYTLADTGTVVTGVVIFLLILPLVLFEFPFFPLGTTPAVLLGAVLMVCTTVLSQDDAYRHLGEPGNMRTIALLLGMMLMAQYFEREKIIDRMISRILKDDISFASYLWRVCLATSVTSAFITNDAACVVLTPLWLENWKNQNRPRVELKTLLLAIATSANIGSAATIFGNPQMALIASKTNVPHFRQSRLDLLRCIMFIGLPTIIGSVLNVCFLIIHWKIRSRSSHKERNNTVNKKEQRKAFIGKNKNTAIEMISDDEHSLGNTNVDSMNATDKEHMNGNGTSSTQHQNTSGSTVQNISTSHLEASEFETKSLNQSTNQASLRNTHQYAKSLSNLGQSFPHEKLNKKDCVSFENILLSNKHRVKETESDYHPRYARSGTSLSLKLKTNTSLEKQQCDTQNVDKGRIESNTPFPLSGLQTSKKLGITRSIQSIAIPAIQVTEKACFEIDIQQAVDIEFKASESKPFHICLWISLLALLTLLFVDTDVVHFDMGLLPIATATFLMLVDAVLNKRSAFFIIRRVDWGVLVMFFGLFVWMAGFNATRIPRWIWKTMGLSHSKFNSFSSLTILCVFVVVCSNIFSNVPLTIIVLEQLQPCTNQFPLVLYLAWCSTIAGNLTLFGSVANLIVAQKSKTSLGYQFSYWTYFKYGFVTTCFIVVIGMAIMNVILQVV
ncbi:silicon efflux transporter LSI2-like [Gigantopelta aegis]|uniref:silicon efflux transporter LSI2-like n=1 Tax=Gigantopelta aegis TaxID=1735272 RepID=UPI001B88DBE2|nr:silicon efflux transporter LSI2-like [Gigantopelta aegis]